MNARTDPMDLPLRIGRFVVRRLLGEGGTSRVYLADDPHLERPVAIKWLKTGAGSGLNEARLTARLSHPNVVPLYEAGVFRTTPYLVFAYVEGATLRELRDREGPMPASRALPLFLSVLDGVASAHARGVLHLDLSPANIIVDRTGIPRVMDFGQARLAAATLPGTADDVVVGTPRYMSPEHFRGEPLTARSDVYALGLILFEILTGRSLLPSDSLVAIAGALSRDTPDLGILTRVGVDARLQAVVRRALQPDPRDRFADAGEFRQALASILGADAEGRSHGTVEFLLHRMQRKANFPALSSTLVDINRLTAEGSRAGVDALAKVVLRDYAVTNRLLKLANSSYFGRSPRGVNTVSEAIHMLGTNVVRMTCNGLAYLGAMQGGSAALREAMIASFAAGLLARHLAIHLGRVDLAEEAFICGMFNKLGKSLTLFYFDEEFAEIERLVAEKGLAEEQASALVLGLPYSELGLAVAGRWKFPETICESLRLPPPGPLKAPATDLEMQRQLAAFAGELCELAARCAPEQAGTRLDAFANRYHAMAGVPAARLPELLGSATRKLQEFAPLLGLQTAGSRFVESASRFSVGAAAPVEAACPA